MFPDKCFLQILNNMLNCFINIDTIHKAVIEILHILLYCFFNTEARHKTVIEELSDENLEHLVQQLLLRRQLRKTNIKDQSSTHHSARHATDVNSRREVKKLQSKSKDRSGNVSKYDDEQMMEVFNNLKVRDELHQISERLKVGI